jgi:hypothetical protein
VGGSRGPNTSVLPPCRPTAVDRLPIAGRSTEALYIRQPEELYFILIQRMIGWIYIYTNVQYTKNDAIEQQTIRAQLGKEKETAAIGLQKLQRASTHSQFTEVIQPASAREFFLFFHSRYVSFGVFSIHFGHRGRGIVQSIRFDSFVFLFSSNW